MKALQRPRIRLPDSAKASTRVPKARQTRKISTSTSNVTVGIRKEDPGRLWERRCERENEPTACFCADNQLYFSGPVTPDAVHELVREGVQVLIQPCERRVWPNEEFVKVRVLFALPGAYVINSRIIL